MNLLDLINQIVLSIIALKGPTLMIVFLVMLGYLLKMIPQIPNQRIPIIIMCAGPLLAPFFITWPQPGQMEPGLRYPEVAAYFQVCAMGFLMSASAWISHAKILKRFVDDKLNGELNPNQKTEPPKP